jgi:hypothetical protein
MNEQTEAVTIPKLLFIIALRDCGVFDPPKDVLIVNKPAYLEHIGPTFANRFAVLD